MEGVAGVVVGGDVEVVGSTAPVAWVGKTTDNTQRKAILTVIRVIRRTDTVSAQFTERYSKLLPWGRIFSARGERRSAACWIRRTIGTTRLHREGHQRRGGAGRELERVTFQRRNPIHNKARRTALRNVAELSTFCRQIARIGRLRDGHPSLITQKEEREHPMDGPLMLRPNPGVSVVIPTKNEARNIAWVLKLLPKCGG